MVKNTKTELFDQNGRKDFLRNQSKAYNTVPTIKHVGGGTMCGTGDGLLKNEDFLHVAQLLL